MLTIVGAFSVGWLGTLCGTYLAGRQQGVIRVLSRLN
jgi:hypothetical protein